MLARTHLNLTTMANRTTTRGNNSLQFHQIVTDPIQISLEIKVLTTQTEIQTAMVTILGVLYVVDPILPWIVR
jgi:hypothetical protein